MIFANKVMNTLTLCTLCVIMLQLYLPICRAEITTNLSDARTQPVDSLHTNFLGLFKKILSENPDTVNLLNQAAVGQGRSRLQTSLRSFLESLSESKDISHKKVPNLVKQLDGAIQKTVLKASISQIRNLDAKIAEGARMDEPDIGGSIARHTAGQVVDPGFMNLLGPFLAQISTNSTNNLNETSKLVGTLVESMPTGDMLPQLFGQIIQMVLKLPPKTLANLLKIVLTPQIAKPLVSAMPGVFQLIVSDPETWANISVNQQCANDTKTILNDSLSGGSRGRMFFDSMGKLPEGILQGNIHWLGDSRECEASRLIMESQEDDNSSDSQYVISGKYCLLRIPFPNQFVSGVLKEAGLPDQTATLSKLSIGVCFPETCAANDLIVFAQSAFGFVLSSFGVDPTSLVVDCPVDQRPQIIHDAKAIVVIVICTIIIFLVVAATIYDFYTNRPIQTSFDDTEISPRDSVSENWLLKHRSGNTAEKKQGGKKMYLRKQLSKSDRNNRNSIQETAMNGDLPTSADVRWLKISSNIGDEKSASSTEISRDVRKRNRSTIEADVEITELHEDPYLSSRQTSCTSQADMASREVTIPIDDNAMEPKHPDVGLNMSKGQIACAKHSKHSPGRKSGTSVLGQNEIQTDTGEHSKTETSNSEASIPQVGNLDAGYHDNKTYEDDNSENSPNIIIETPFTRCLDKIDGIELTEINVNPKSKSKYDRNHSKRKPPNSLQRTNVSDNEDNQNSGEEAHSETEHQDLDGQVQGETDDGQDGHSADNIKGRWQSYLAAGKVSPKLETSVKFPFTEEDINYQGKRKKYPERDSLYIQSLLAFSLRRNFKRIFHTDGGSKILLAFNGIRFLTMAWIILGHTYVLGLFAFANAGSFLMEMRDTWTYLVITNAFFAVDSMFLIGGTLVSYRALHAMRKNNGKLKITYCVIHRLWRLTPLYLLILMLYTCLYRYLGSGPLWMTSIMDSGPVQCESTWWWNVLYINNFKATPEMCMSWTWYLSVDMQFFIITPLLLLALYRSAIAGLMLTLLCTTLSSVAAAVTTSKNDLPAHVIFQNGTSFFDDYYTKPWCRASPYLIGVAVGYIMYRTKSKLYLHKSIVVGLWLLAVPACFGPIYGMHAYINGSQKWSLIETQSYNALGRTSWSLGIGWLLLACNTGNGGFVTHVLSMRKLIPLARISYCAYLIHPIVMRYYFETQNRLLYMNDGNMVYLFFGFLMTTYGLALVFSVAFEAPMVMLEKVALNWKQKKT